MVKLASFNTHVNYALLSLYSNICKRFPSSVTQKEIRGGGVDFANDLLHNGKMQIYILLSNCWECFEFPVTNSFGLVILGE